MNKFIGYFVLSNIFMILVVALSASAQVVVVPNNLADTDGNFSNGAPWNCGAAAHPSQRYQQVYVASQFQQTGLIDVMSFRLDPDISSFGPTILQDVQIDMSITQAGPNTLSSTFDDNLGPVVTNVFSGDLTLQGTSCSAPGPCPFSVDVLLDESYLYNPMEGNLLIDVRINNCVVLNPGVLTVFDAVNSSDITGRVTTVGGQNVNSPTGTPVNQGLVTQFTLSPIPTPPTAEVPTLSEWGLIALASILGVLGFMVIRRRQATA